MIAGTQPSPTLIEHFKDPHATAEEIRRMPEKDAAQLLFRYSASKYEIY